MRSTIQEENLAGKSAFEGWAATFEVKINIYHADNGIFSEQSFRSEIEDANHTITFCVVGYHHQNVTVERKIQTLTLESRILLLYAKNIGHRQ